METEKRKSHAALKSIEEMLKMDLLRIGELSKLSGVRHSTIKFYIEEGLLSYERSDSKAIRRFNRKQAMARLNEIQKLKEKRFTIDEIREKLNGQK